MSTVGNDRYSLDYDPEFEEMLNKFKSAKFHSSLIDESEHDDDGNHTRSNILWSPCFSPINIVDSPVEKQSSGRKLQSRLQTRRRSSAHKQIMQVDNVVIELSDDDTSSDEAFDSGTEDVDSIDLNATYTAKTMGNRRLSRMLDVLKEIESDEELEHGMANMKIQTEKQLSKKYNKPQLPVPQISPYTPSPCTPCIKNKPPLQRGYRLVPVNECESNTTPRSIATKSNSKKRPHESNITNGSIF